MRNTTVFSHIRRDGGVNTIFDDIARGVVPDEQDNRTEPIPQNTIDTVEESNATIDGTMNVQGGLGLDTLDERVFNSDMIFELGETHLEPVYPFPSKEEYTKQNNLLVDRIEELERRMEDMADHLRDRDDYIEYLEERKKTVDSILRDRDDYIEYLEERKKTVDSMFQRTENRLIALEGRFTRSLKEIDSKHSNSSIQSIENRLMYLEHKPDVEPVSNRVRDIETYLESFNYDDDMTFHSTYYG